MSEGASAGEASGRGEPSNSDTGGSAGQDELADRLSDLARLLEQQEDVEQTLDAIVHGAVGTVPGAEHASISVVRRRREVMTRASTSELPRAVDHAQYVTGQGGRAWTRCSTRRPCCCRTCRASGAGRRSPTALPGSGSAHAEPAAVRRGRRPGALNLLITSPESFDDESEHVALLFASHAATALAGAEQQQLRSAMHIRDLIGQAKGILMGRFKISGEGVPGAGARQPDQQPQAVRDRPGPGRQRRAPHQPTGRR